MSWMMIPLIFHSIWWLWLHVWGYSYLWCYTWSDVISYRFRICPFPGYIVFVAYTSNINTSPKTLVNSINPGRIKDKGPHYSIPERILYWVWNQQQRREIIVNATWCKTRNLALQSTIVHKEKVSQISAPSEQSPKFITNEVLQQKHWCI